MLAAGLNSNVGRAHHSVDMPLGVTLFLSVDFDVDNVAGRTEWNEYHHLIFLGDAFAFGRHIYNLYFLKQWKLFAFSCHRF